MIKNEKIRIIERNQIIKNKWDDFVIKNKSAWIWHLYDFQDSISTWKLREDLSFAIVDNSGDESEICAVMPLQLVKKRIPFCPFYFKYLDSNGSLIIKNELVEHRTFLIELAYSYLKVLKKRHMAILLNVGISNLAPIYRDNIYPKLNSMVTGNFIDLSTSTCILKLSNETPESIWKTFRKHVKASIKKAENSKIIIREALCTYTDLSIYYNLHLETYKRTNTEPHPKEYFESIWFKFLKYGYSKIYFAELNGDVIAAVNLAIFKECAYYWTGASLEIARPTQANYLLQWTSIKWMLENKILFYELGEVFSNHKQKKVQQISDFKKKFGGIVYPRYKVSLTLKSKLAEMIFRFIKFLNILKKLSGYLKFIFTEIFMIFKNFNNRNELEKNSNKL